VCWYTGAWPGREPPGSRPVDVGGATAKGIVNLRDRGPDRPSGAGPGSAGNGSLMRCLPTALFQPDLGLMLRESAAVSALTHDDARCTAACAAYNACVAALVAGAHPDYAVRAAELTAAQIEDAAGIDPGRGPVLAALRLGRALSIPRAAAHGPHKDFFPGKCAGYVLETLTLAIAAVLDPRSLEDVLVDVVRLGADTDTNAAVAGGLLGARDGIDAIPQRWRNTLQFGPEFQRLALDIMSTMD
jgi:ADP-ribosylglycohydrolase